MPKDDEETGPKPHFAKVDDEFIRHPYTRSYIRNPLLDKSQRGKPIVWAKEDFEHNHLGDALKDWKEIRISEKNFTHIMTGKQTGRATPEEMRKAHAPLGRLGDYDVGYEFLVSLEKIENPKDERRRGRRRDQARLGTAIEKMGIEVSESSDGKSIIVESVGDGMINTWNRTYPGFVILPGDHIIKINEKTKNSQEMLEECKNADGAKLTIRRVAGNRARNQPDETADAPTGK
eukprot:gnl/MRDRNA2_/MRDRNA2_111299_c0_seq1.p1 gnl/MRDRNA2_/MRDRNA2_111299_c0~~gnl/MRDRNA2_/MRDRNA2_111299_c0_seq1.p1  ORF type:complete len:261 (+),score=36.73 gnl/MRDRNA2_/MRDRNA2_111299_c0_seq1:87-785(+)